MPRSPNVHWMLPGPSAPYLIVSWHTGAARKPSRQVPPFSVVRQLDRWLKSRRPLLLEIYEALGGQLPKVALGVGSTKYDEQLKKGLADAFMAGKLVAIEVPVDEQKERQHEGSFDTTGVASQSTPGTAARSVSFKSLTKSVTFFQKQAAGTSPSNPSGSSSKKISWQSEPSAEAVTITFELTKSGKNTSFRAGILSLSFQANGVSVMRLNLPYGDAAKLVGLKWSTSLPHKPHTSLAVVGTCSLEGATNMLTGPSSSSQLSFTDTVTPGSKGKLSTYTRDFSNADVTVKYSVKSIPLETFQSLPGLSVVLSAGGQPLKDFYHSLVLVKGRDVTVVARPKSSLKEKFEVPASNLYSTYSARGEADGYTPAEYDVLTTEGRHEVHLPLKSETLYRLVKGQNAYAVVAVEPDQGPVVQQEGELPLMTQQELDELLARQGIFQIDASALQGWMTRMGSPPISERALPKAFATEPGPLNGIKWRGTVGEIYTQNRTQGLMLQDLNRTVQNQFPIFDFRQPGDGDLVSVKTSVRNQLPQNRAQLTNFFSTYLDGLNDLIGGNPNKTRLAARQLYPELTPGQAQALFAHKGHIAVNADHVAPLRELLQDPTSYQSANICQRIADAYLRLNPVVIDGRTLTSWQALQNELNNTANTQAVRQQILDALSRFYAWVGEKIGSNGVTTAHLRNLQSFRNSITLNYPGMTSPQVESWVFPELLLATKHGGGMPGHLKAMGSMGVRGGIGGSLMAMVMESGLILFDSRKDPLQDLFRTGVASGFAGVAEGVVSAGFNANAGSSIARAMVRRGLPPSLATGTGRGLGGGLGGGVAAPVFELGSMALDDQVHTREDYVARGTRAFVSGSLSSAVTAGVVGAIWGSEVPILGNAVGFIVGFAGYLLVDALVGDDVEDAVRDEMD